MMNWKKWLKYIGITLIILTAILVMMSNRLGRQIYGGLTTQVDYEQFEPKEGPVAITNVNVLAPDGNSFIAGQTVLIDNGLIEAIDSIPTFSDQITIIDGSGKYLIPGLVDAHVHLFQSSNDLLLYVANGVTEIRELIGEENHLKWRKQIENGRVGPRMFVASPRLGSFSPMEGFFMSYTQGFMNIEDAEDAKQTVKELFDEGYDGIKVYSHLNKESYLAITETAKSLGMPVFGHIPFAVSLEDIWENGQSGIAHFEELMNALQREFNPSHGQWFGSFAGSEDEFLTFVAERSDELADRLIENDIAVTSTLWLVESFPWQKFDLDQLLQEVELAYANPGISEWVSFIPQGLGWLPAVNRFRLADNLTEEQLAGEKRYWETYVKAVQIIARKMAARDVKIMAGTDANLPPTVPGFSLHDELVSLQGAGMSNAQVLRAATSTPAAWLNSNAGTVAVGYDANLVLLDKNPLADMANTQSINTVITNGRVFDRTLLDQMLATVKAANDQSREVDISGY